MDIGHGLKEPIRQSPTLEDAQELIRTLEKRIDEEIKHYCVSLDLQVDLIGSEDRLEIVCDRFNGFTRDGSFIEDGWEFEKTETDRIDKNKYGLQMTYALHLLETLLDESNGMVAIHWDAVVYYDSKTKTCGFHLYDENDSTVTVTIAPHYMELTTTTIH